MVPQLLTLLQCKSNRDFEVQFSWEVSGSKYSGWMVGGEAKNIGIRLSVLVQEQVFCFYFYFYFFFKTQVSDFILEF